MPSIDDENKGTSRTSDHGSESSSAFGAVSYHPFATTIMIEDSTLISQSVAPSECSESGSFSIVHFLRLLLSNICAFHFAAVPLHINSVRTLSFLVALGE